MSIVETIRYPYNMCIYYNLSSFAIVIVVKKPILGEKNMNTLSDIMRL